MVEQYYNDDLLLIKEDNSRSKKNEEVFNNFIRNKFKTDKKYNNYLYFMIFIIESNKDSIYLIKLESDTEKRKSILFFLFNLIQEIDDYNEIFNKLSDKMVQSDIIDVNILKNYYINKDNKIVRIIKKM